MEALRATVVFFDHVSRLATRFGNVVVSNLLVGLLCYYIEALLKVCISSPLSHIPRSTPQTVKFPCLICMDDFEDPSVLHVPDCNHTFCRDCMSTYFRGKLEDRVYPVSCPMCLTLEHHTSSKSSFISADLEDQLDLNFEEKKKLSQLQIALHTLSLKCICCEKEMTVQRRDYETKRFVNCPQPNCQHRWCKHCEKALRPGKTTHSCIKNKEVEKLARKRGWKTCPGCGVLVERTVGCDHMICSIPTCSVHFCYRCGDILGRSSAGAIAIRVAITEHSTKCQPEPQGRSLRSRLPNDCSIQ
ncbi:hypothetical protein CPB83DRAFT_808801 [Crepidotus variabilis]|uniref:Uncharacterized protein n=1 Tax=Crepidotus variabilis TaxID=179855 RepID=A0A9P6EL07_9AGAR|nr:hypothetical protein CPB83DRAFT_808801 [Crepidotus variabilis]